jgi:transcriptional regulator with GAF, ATPase, and Fis domain/serine/threonine protein kinase
VRTPPHFALYRALAQLDTPRSSTVWRAERLADGGTVIIKLHRRDAVPRGGRFLSELECLARLAHPNLARLLDFGQTLDTGDPFLVFEDVAGEEFVTASKEVSKEDFLDLIMQLIRALDYLQARETIHGDLKPANILVVREATAAGRQHHVKVIDLGSALFKGRLRSGIEGTPYYMAPEVIRGEGISPASDLYSLGAILYECLSGSPPHGRLTPGAALQKHLDDPPALIQEHSLRELHPLIFHLLSPEPERRPSSPQELFRALKSVTADDKSQLHLDTTWKALACSGPLVGQSPLPPIVQQIQSHLNGDPVSRPIVFLIQGILGGGKSRVLWELGVSAKCHGLKILRLSQQETTTASRVMREAIGSINLASTGPLLFIYDRHGSFSPDERRFISDLVGSLSPRSALAIAIDLSSATEEADIAFVRSALASTALQVITLKPLGPEAISSYVTQALAVRETPAKLSHALEHATGGIPYLLTATLTHYLQQGRLKIAHRNIAFEEIHDPQSFESIEAYLDAQQKALPPEALSIEALLATALEPLPASTISQVTGVEGVAVERSLQRLLTRGLLCRARETGESAYSLSSALVCSELRRRLGHLTQQEWHTRLARFYAANPGVTCALDLTARHFAAAGHKAEATRYAVAAALTAEQEGAQERTASLYRCALDQGIGSPQERARMTIGLCRALMALDSHSEALQHLAELDRLGEIPIRLKVRIALQRALCAGRMGDLKKWEQESRNALRLARSIESTVDEVEALCELGAALCWQEDVDAGKRMLVRARVRAQRMNLLQLASRTLRAISYALWKRGQFELALAYGRRRVRLATRISDGFEQARALQGLSILEFELGHYRKARVHAFRSLRILQSKPTDTLACGLENNIAETYLITGRIKAAKQFYSRAFQGASKTHQEMIALIVGANLVLSLVRAGFFGNCQVGLKSRLKLSGALGSSQAASVILVVWAALLSTTGRYSAARRLLAYSSTFAESKGLRHVILRYKVLMCRVLLEEGRPDLARPLLKDALRTHEDYSSFDVRVEARLLEIQLDQVLGASLEDIESRLAPILMTCRKKRMDWHWSWCLMIAAEALLSVNRGDDSLQGLEEALKLARRNGDRTLAWEISFLMGRVHEQGLRYERALGCYRAAALTVLEMAQDLEDERYRTAFLARPPVKEAVERYERMRSEVGRRARRDLATLNRSEMVSRKMLAALSDIGQKLATSLDLDELLQRTLDLAIENVHAERGMIFLRDEGSGELRLACARGMDRQSLGEVESFSRTVVRQVAEGRTLLTIDVGSDPLLSGYQSLVLHEIKSILCVPMRSRGVVAGVIYLDTQRAAQLFTDKERAFVESFAGQAAVAIENARLFGRMQDENSRLRQEIEGRSRFAGLVGSGPAMRGLTRLIAGVLDSDCNVLITGESGTGKELVARALHHHGPRAGARFVAIDCGALPETLLEAELFGYARGAFTGADRDRGGLIEEAHGGSLFLDEITNTSVALQARLLRVLQEREVRRVGENRPRQVDVRVIAATNADLEILMREGRFRRDLYYRLNVVTIAVPPLRERREDIPLLVEHFLERRAGAGEPRKRLGPGVLEALMGHDWPGNVRELDNVIERLSILSSGPFITFQDLPIDLRPPSPGARGTDTHPTDGRKTGEQMMIEEALKRFAGDKAKAARFIGWNRQKLYRRMREYRIATDYGKAA